MQTPHTHEHPADAIAGKPAPTENATCRRRACPRCSRRALTGTTPTPSQASLLQQRMQPVGAGLARDAVAAHSLAQRRRHRRQDLHQHKPSSPIWPLRFPCHWRQSPWSRGSGTRRSAPPESRTTAAGYRRTHTTGLRRVPCGVIHRRSADGSRR